MAKKRGHKKQKLTANQRAYKKEIQRLQAGINYYKKLGKIEGMEEVTLAFYRQGTFYNPIPSMPKRVSKKSLEAIRKLKPKDIIKSEDAIYISYDTGEIIPAQVRIEQTKRRRKKKKKKPITYERPDAETIIKDAIDEFLGDEVDLEPEPDTDTSYYPTLTIVDGIKKMLSEIPEYRFVGYNIAIPTGKLRDELLRILDDNISMAEIEGYLSEYIDYLKDNENAIFQWTLVIIYDSDQYMIMNGVSQIAQIFNYGQVLSKSLKQKLEDILNGYEAYED